MVPGKSSSMTRDGLRGTHRLRGRVQECPAAEAGRLWHHMHRWQCEVVRVHRDGTRTLATVSAFCIGR